MEYIKDYFRAFGHKLCCFDDLKPYLSRTQCPDTLIAHLKELDMPSEVSHLKQFPFLFFFQYELMYRTMCLVFSDVFAWQRRKDLSCPMRNGKETSPTFYLPSMDFGKSIRMLYHLARPCHLPNGNTAMILSRWLYIDCLTVTI
jgi:hypothetical protein